MSFHTLAEFEHMRKIRRSTKTRLSMRLRSLGVSLDVGAGGLILMLPSGYAACGTNGLPRYSCSADELFAWGIKNLRSIREQIRRHA